MVALRGSPLLAAVNCVLEHLEAGASTVPRLSLLEPWQVQALDVAEWAAERHTPIEAVDIMERWGMHRATAYRWRPHLEQGRIRAAKIRQQRRAGASP